MDLYKQTIHELRDLLDKKEVSALELTECMLDRIDVADKAIEGYLTVTADLAREKAKQVDKKIKDGEALGMLAGIPGAIKDNMCTEGILTTCASKMLNNFVPPYNATVVNKILDADGIILGKVNLDEFAMGSSTENSHYKKTKNPYNLAHVPGGSSGGSAAVVAGDEAIYSLGSDTGGSIRQPAAFCGVVGMKPTYGLVSRFGLVAFASSLDQIGPVTKDVTDAAIVLNTIAGHDPKDSTSYKLPKVNYLDALVQDVKGLKIGVPKEYMTSAINEEIKGAINQALDVFKGLGAGYDECSIPLAEYSLPAYYLISSAEASSNLARFDGIKYGYKTENYNTLSELYTKTRSEGFGDEVKRRIMLGTYALSSGYYDAYYKKALQVRTLIQEDYRKTFEEYDVIITPVSPTTAWKFGEKSENPLEMYLADLCTVSVNIAGLPAIVVPCGLDKQGLPIGIQIIAKHFDESLLLRTAYAFEQNTNHHKHRPTDFLRKRGDQQ